jgi:hypothetical protein
MSRTLRSAILAGRRAHGLGKSVLPATAQEFQGGFTHWPQRVPSTAAIELKIAVTCVGERVMRGALKQADCHHGDHALGGISVESCEGSRRRIEPSADYCPVLIRAVDRLEPNTAQARRKIYDRARAAMVAQLRSVTPSLAESDIAREQAALESAIRQVEAASLRHLDDPAQPSTELAFPRLPRNASGTRVAVNPSEFLSRGPLLAEDDDAGDECQTLAARLHVSRPDLSVELEHLQNQIRHHAPRGWFVARKLVSIAVLVVLVVVALAPAAL